MRIIGEKINGTRRQVGEAIASRDALFVQTLAKRQVEAGAHWLDINAGTPPAQEPDDLVWLVNTVQEAVDVPLCLDSANPMALAAAIAVVRQEPLINSLSGEGPRLAGTLPLLREHRCPVIALALDDNGIPKNAEQRLSVVRHLIEEIRDAGLPDDKIYVDPLALAIATEGDSGVVAVETIRAVHVEFPAVHFCAGLSNISFGLPERSLVNRVFLTLAVAAGLDTAIVDPLNRELTREIIAAELVLGRDPYCRNFTRAYRAGKLQVGGPAAATK